MGTDLRVDEYTAQMAEWREMQPSYKFPSYNPHESSLWLVVVRLMGTFFCFVVSFCVVEICKFVALPKKWVRLLQVACLPPDADPRMPRLNRAATKSR